MANLNYSHLRYFREVAREGNLTRAAGRLNLSQSALSSQIKLLEARLGHDLFQRVGRGLELTEVGRIALDHADRIFQTGDDLMAVLSRSGGGVPPLRVGARPTLSRNFQMRFLAPVLDHPDLRLELRSGPGAALLDALDALALDVVLTTEPPRDRPGLVATRLDGQSVGLHGVSRWMSHGTLRDLLADAPLVLPTEPTIRAGFEALVAMLGVTPRVLAEVDDMAMLRLLTRSGAGVALAPAVVLADEIAQGLIVTAPFDLALEEAFYAVTATRSFPHPLLEMLLAG